MKNFPTNFIWLASVKLVFVMMFLSTSLEGQTIAVTTLSATTICAGNTVTVTFITTNGNGSPRHYDSGSAFTAYLSSATGAAPYTSLGTLSFTHTFTGGNGAQNTITATATIPAGTVTATGYKISVGSSGPSFTANDGTGAKGPITINAVSGGGTVSGAQTICSGTQPASLTLSGQTGAVIKWQKASDAAFTAPTNIASTSSTLTGAIIGNLSASTYFRAVVQSGTCGTANSSSVLVTVNPASTGGTVSSAQTICSGTQPAGLTLSGHAGNVIKWQKSSDAAFTSPTDIANTATTLTGAAIGSLSANTYFRAVVQNGSCTIANSSVVLITVAPVSVGGSVSSSQAICSGTQPSNLLVSGYAGSIIKWQKSTSAAFTSPADIAVTSATLTGAIIGNLTSTTYFRAVVQNGSCVVANSASATVTVNPASVGGTVSSDQTICGGTQPMALSLSGYAGTILKWQKSADAAFTIPVDIANTSATLTGAAIGTLVTGAYFRAAVQNGSCAVAYSVAAHISISGTASVGTIGGALPICAGTVPADLHITGNSGNVIKWQMATDAAFTAPVDIAVSISTLSDTQIGVLNTTTYFRVVIQNGNCGMLFSPVAVITVTPAPVGGTIAGQSICPGTQAGDLMLSGHTGSVVKWQQSTDAAFTAPADIANASATLSGAAIGNLSQTKWFRAVVGNGSCFVTYSAPAQITVRSTTWNGASWSDGVPDSASAVVITGNFTASADFSACTLTVNNNAVVQIPSGFNVTLNGSLTVTSGSFTLANNASLIQLTNAANSGNIIVKRNSSALKRQDYTLWSSPVSGQKLLAFSPQTLTNRFYTYATDTNFYNGVTDPANTAFGDATGYLIRMPNNHPTWASVWNGQFSGVPHNGTYTVAMANAGAGKRFNLVGNPYPSPISAYAFVANNAGNITGTLYFWRKTNNAAKPSYCSWTGAGFVGNDEDQVVDPNGIIETGQGFFVEAKGNATTVTFNNAQRTASNANQFFRSADDNQMNRIWLNASNESGAFSQMLVNYMTGATMGVDDNIDGKYINDGAIALNSIVDNTDYVIQGRPLPFDAADVVPLSFMATTAGNYTIAIDHMDGVFSSSQDVLLKDNLNGVTHDLKAGSYAFASEAGTFASRFEVLYQSQLGVDHPEFDNQTIVYKQGGRFVVHAGTSIIDKIEVYDLSGRLLLERHGINASETEFAVDETNEMAVVKITSDTKMTVTRKIIK